MWVSGENGGTSVSHAGWSWHNKTKFYNCANLLYLHDLISMLFLPNSTRTCNTHWFTLSQILTSTKWPTDVAPVSTSEQPSSKASARCGSDLQQFTSSLLLVLTLYCFLWSSEHPELPAFLFCVCRPDLLSSLLKLTFCLVLSNDERAHGRADNSLPSWEDIQSLTDTYQSPNTAGRQNTSPSVFLLRCKVFYGKNAGCMWHCEKIWHISGIQLSSSL